MTSTGATYGTESSFMTEFGLFRKNPLHSAVLRGLGGQQLGTLELGMQQQLANQQLDLQRQLGLATVKPEQVKRFNKHQQDLGLSGFISEIQDLYPDITSPVKRKAIQAQFEEAGHVAPDKKKKPFWKRWFGPQGRDTSQSRDVS